MTRSLLRSGMAAISSIFHALASQGDEIAFIDPVYGGTAAFLIQTLTRAGITVRRYQDDDHLLSEISFSRDQKLSYLSLLPIRP